MLIPRRQSDRGAEDVFFHREGVLVRGSRNHSLLAHPCEFVKVYRHEEPQRIGFNPSVIQFVASRGIVSGLNSQPLVDCVRSFLAAHSWIVTARGDRA